MNIKEKVEEIVKTVESSEYAKTRKNLKEALKVAEEGGAKDCVLYPDRAGGIYVCDYGNAREIGRRIHEIIDFVNDVKTYLVIADKATVKKKTVSEYKLDTPAKILYSILRGKFKVIPISHDEIWVELEKVKNAGIYLSIIFFIN